MRVYAKLPVIICIAYRQILICIAMSYHQMQSKLVCFGPTYRKVICLVKVKFTKFTHAVCEYMQSCQSWFVLPIDRYWFALQCRVIKCKQRLFVLVQHTEKWRVTELGSKNADVQSMEFSHLVKTWRSLVPLLLLNNFETLQTSQVV